MNADPNPAKAVFLEAVERHAPDQWPAFLDGACAGQPDLRGQVEALLGAHQEVGTAQHRELAERADPSPVATIDLPPVTEVPGTVIGSYKLLQQIGEGGMGTVYMAEQTQPIQRKVALKIIKAGMDSKQVIARFEAERQALAMMDHVNIARVFDAGTTASGRPYFVMELVNGVPITKYCDDNHLSPRERLELFVPVCQAIQHAHQKGIIHRDIKPSNVMITLYDGMPVPKVIDFGVAKATEHKLTERTLFTQYGSMVGTLEYMSPEQAEMSALGVDTRSDVYSLGVLLYELLTGSTPLTHKRMKEAGYAEILRMIKEEEPPKPSTRLSDSGEALASISANRHMEPAKLTKLFRGEVDWIVMKALEKDRSRRYETANGFAADVQCYLNDETVKACPPSAGYRFRKFARRNKRALVMASIIGVALLLAVGSLGWTLRDREAGSVRTASEVNQFLQRTEALYADNKLPEAVAEVQKARGVLEAGRGDENLERRVRQWLTDLDTATQLEEIRLGSFDREDRAQGYADYAQVFRDYGIDVEALSTDEVVARVAASQIRLDLALALRNWSLRLRFDPRPQDPARWQRLMAISQAADPDPERLRLDEAVEAKDVQTLRELADGADPSRMRTRTLAYLGSSLKTAGDTEAAVAFLRTSQRQHPGDFSINSSLALCLSELKPPQLEEAITFRRVALAVRPQSAWAHYRLGYALYQKDRLDEAIVEYREAIRRRPGYVYAHNDLGAALMAQGKVDEAVACFKKAIELDPNAALAYSNHGIALSNQGNLDEAIACYRKAIELDPNFALAYSNLGLALKNQGKLDEAVACYRKAVELDPTSARAYRDLAHGLIAQKELSEAVAVAEKAINLEPKNDGGYYYLGHALSGQGKLPEAIAAYRTAINLNPNNASAYVNLGIALSNQGKLPEAVDAYQQAIKLNPKNANAYTNLGAALHKQRKLPEAIAAHQQAIKLNPKNATAYSNLALTLVELRDPQKLPEAIAAAKKAIEINPKYADAYHVLGQVLAAQQKLDDAIAAYRTAIKLDPKHPHAHLNLGMDLARQGKHDQAIACCRTALEINPKNIGAYVTLGISLRKVGKLDEAIACYRAVLEIDPSLGLAHGNLGNVLWEKGQLDEAIACYRRAIELDPKDVAARNNLGSALRARGWQLVKNTDPRLWEPKRAVEFVKEAVELAPQSSGAWQYLGWVQYRAGNWKASIEALEESCKLQKGSDAGQWIVQALAHAKLAAQDGVPNKARALHKMEAQRRFDQADKWIDSKWSVRPGDQTGQAIWDFRAEARELMAAKESKK